MQDRTYVGPNQCRTRRVGSTKQGRKDASRCRIGSMQDNIDRGPDRTQDKTDPGQDACRTGQMTERRMHHRDAWQDGCFTGWLQYTKLISAEFSKSSRSVLTWSQLN